MPATLPTLIKLAERQVEAAQRALAATRQAIAAVQAHMARLHEEEVAAFVQGMGEDTVKGLQAASAFQERVRQTTARLKVEEETLHAQAAAHQQTLQAAYGAQKRYELLHAKALEKEKQARARKAQQALDEAASHLKH